jgi:thioredoxin-like negative regulator of GroEL
VNDFNRVIEDIINEHGHGNVAFLKVDGQRIRALSQRYKISSYPKFIAVKGGSDGNRYEVFGGSSRTYDNLRQWVLGLMGSSASHHATLAETGE